MHPQRGVAELYAAELVFCALLSMMVLAYTWKKVKLVLDGSIHGLKRSLSKSWMDPLSWFTRMMCSGLSQLFDDLA